MTRLLPPRAGVTRLLLPCTAAAFLAVGLLIPAIPRHVTGPLGQGPGMVGGCLAITAVCALLARPLAGRIADGRGRRTAACLGLALLSISTAAVLLADSLPLFLTCRAVAGAGEALMYVGLATAAADHERPRAAVNHFSVAINAGLLAGPALAEAIRSTAGPRAVWALSAAVALAACAGCLSLPGSVTARPTNKGPLIHRAGLIPGLAYWASVWGYTAFTAFLPLQVAGGTGTHFLLYGCVVLAVRLAGQRPLARFSPRATATAALALTALGLIILATWSTTTGALVAAAVIGAGQALGLPAFLTMALSAAPAEERGAAVATTTAFFDLGFLSAALVLGAVAQSAGLEYGFAVAAGVAALAPLLFLPHLRGESHDHSPR